MRAYINNVMGYWYPFIHYTPKNFVTLHQSWYCLCMLHCLWESSTFFHLTNAVYVSKISINNSVHSIEFSCLLNKTQLSNKIWTIKFFRLSKYFYGNIQNKRKKPKQWQPSTLSTNQNQFLLQIRKKITNWA